MQPVIIAVIIAVAIAAIDATASVQQRASPSAARPGERDSVLQSTHADTVGRQSACDIQRRTLSVAYTPRYRLGQLVRTR